MHTHTYTHTITLYWVFVVISIYHFILHHTPTFLCHLPAAPCTVLRHTDLELPHLPFVLGIIPFNWPVVPLPYTVFWYLLPRTRVGRNAAATDCNHHTYANTHNVCTIFADDQVKRSNNHGKLIAVHLGTVSCSFTYQSRQNNRRKWWAWGELHCLHATVVSPVTNFWSGVRCFVLFRYFF